MQTNNNGYGENRKIISGSSVELSPASIGHNSGVAVVTEHEYSFEVIEAMELSWRAVTLPQQIEAAFVHGAGPILDPIKIPAGLQSTTLHKTLFRSQVRLARSDKNLDLRSVLLVLIGAFSANKHCRSTVSATRLAKLLDRSERTIRKYLKVLVEEGYVVRFEQPGFSMALALRLLEVDSNPEVDAVAVLNAIAPHKLGRWGRHDCEPDHLRMTEKSPRNDMASGASMTPESMCSGVRGLTPERNDDDPGTTVVPHNKDSNSSSSGAHTGEDASATLISQSHLNRYYLLVSGWSARPHSADNAPQAFPREQTDRSLRDLVETKARRYGHDDILDALVQALAASEEELEKRRTTEAPMSSKGSSYFAATFENLLSARKARPSPTRDQGAHPFVATSGKIEGLNGHTDQLMELAGTTDPMVFSRVLSEAAGHSRVQPGDHGAGLLIKLRSGIAKVSRFGQADGRVNPKRNMLLR